MSDPADFDADFTSAVNLAARELAGEGGDDPSKSGGDVSEHPDVDTLVDFQEGHLSPDEADRVRRHLAACSTCGRELRKLESFATDESASSDPRPSPEQTAAEWARFQAQLASESAEGRVLEMPDASPPPRELEPEPSTRSSPVGGDARRQARDWLPMAASLLIGVIGFGLWIASQRTGPTSTVPTPRNPYAFDLVPDGEDRVRDAAILPQVVVPAGMDSLLPRLNLGDQTPYGAYRAEVVDDAGTVIWSRGALRRQPTGQFVVIVDDAEMPAGTYRLRVFGLESDEQTELARYTFELSYAPKP